MTLMDFNGITLESVVLRLLLAALFGGIIGFERESTKKPAGLRTHMLICIGSALVMLTGQYVHTAVSPSADPVRLGAQVISGIGFLGIGTIIVVGRQQVRGLTTAAGLWASACMGLAIGVGFYHGAAAGGLLIFLVEAVLRRLDGYIGKYSRTINIYVEVDKSARVNLLREHISNNYAKVQNMIMSREQPVHEDAIGLIFYLHFKEKTEHVGFITALMDYEGVKYVQEL